jgi:MoxR-like ATPase
MTTKERILALAEKAKNPPSWWWKVLGGLILFVMVIWIGYLLSKRSEALAALKTENAKRKLEAQQAEVAAAVETDEKKRRSAVYAAQASLAKAEKDESELVALEAEHQKQLGLLKAVSDKDWDALNKLAGVTP